VEGPGVRPPSGVPLGAGRASAGGAVGGVVADGAGCGAPSGAGAARVAAPGAGPGCPSGSSGSSARRKGWPRRAAEAAASLALVALGMYLLRLMRHEPSLRGFGAFALWAVAAYGFLVATAMPKEKGAGGEGTEGGAGGARAEPDGGGPGRL
jgi:hypothetical protein